MDQIEQPVSSVQVTTNTTSRNIIIGLSIAIVILLAAVVYLLISREEIAPEVGDYNQSQTQPVTETKSEGAQQIMAEWKTYKNEKLGFEIQLTDVWKDYMVKVDDGSQGEGGSQSVKFYVPTTDSVYSGDIQGYASPFVITAYIKSLWETISKEEPRTATYIGEKGMYVYTYSQWQDPPRDLAGKDFEVPKIISTFKFTK